MRTAVAAMTTLCTTWLSPADAWRCDGDAQSETPTRLQRASLAHDPLAICNDGTAAEYYLRANPASSVWLVYLAGGAWCSSPEDCQARWEGAVYPNHDCRLPPGQLEQRCFMSNKDFPEECSKAGMFDSSPENPLADANLVYIPYCSSDAFLGEMAPSGEVPWHFRGQQIVRATMDELTHTHGMGAGGQDATLLFGGGSAGARGAMAWLDLVPELVSDSVRVLGFLDSPCKLVLRSVKLLLCMMPPCASQMSSMRAQCPPLDMSRTLVRHYNGHATLCPIPETTIVWLCSRAGTQDFGDGRR
jgi:hypothetical protein